MSRNAVPLLPTTGEKRRGRENAVCSRAECAGFRHWPQWCGHYPMSQLKYTGTPFQDLAQSFKLPSDEHAQQAIAVNPSLEQVPDTEFLSGLLNVCG